MRPFDVGVDMIESVLDELETVLNWNASAATVSVLQTDSLDWNAPFVISGARAGSSGRAVFRFTPRCLQNSTSDPSSALCTKMPAGGVHNGSIAEMKIGSGFSITPIPGGKFYIPPKATGSPAGFWVVV